jgi:hydrogenase nickel incorporation protein HypA/HybF
MHEYSLMRQVVDEIQAQLAGPVQVRGTVRAVHLTVGQLDIHSAEAFRQAFAMATQATPLEGAALELTVVAARINCPVCGYAADAAEGQLDSHDPSPYVACPRCGAVCRVEGGRGIRAIELTVDDEAE